MKRILVHIILLICIVQQLHSQDDGVVSFDIPARNSLKFNRYMINPTFSFVRESNKYLSFNNKREWTQFDNPPQTFLFSFAGRFQENMGMGIGLFQQNYGVLTTFGGVVNYAYNVVLSQDNNLTFGLNAGFYQSTINDGKVITNFPDPSLDNIENNSLITINPGINYGIGQMDFGLTMNNAVLYNLNSSEMVKDDSAQTFLAHVMYTGYLNSRGFFDQSQFSTLLRSEFGGENTVISGLIMLSVPKGVWSQLGYNTQFGVSGGIGFNITPNIAIEYNYEKTLGDYSALGNSHDITLAYKFNNKKRYYYHDEVKEEGLISTDKKVSRPKPSTKKPDADTRARAAEARKAKQEADAEEKRKVEEDAKKAEEARKAQEEQAKEEAAERAKQEQLEKEKEAEAQKAEEEERAKVEQAKKEAEAEAQRKAREEAQRNAQEEAQRKAQQEADRLAKEEADRIAREEAAQKAQEEADRKAQEETERKAQEEADRIAQEEADRLAQEEADRIAREEAAKKAQEEAERKAREEEERKAKEARAEEQRLAELEEAEQRKADSIANIEAKDPTVKSIKDLAETTTDNEAQQQLLIRQFQEKIAIKREYLKDLKEENDLGDQGIFMEPKPFRSLSAENNAIKAIRADIQASIEDQADRLRKLEQLFATRLQSVPDRNDELNVKYAKAINELKLKQSYAIRTNELLVRNLEKIEAATEVERKRRIERAAYDNETDRYNKDRAALEYLKKTTQLRSTPYEESDFDFGDTNSTIQILKNVSNIESGYYLVIAVHSDQAKRDEFITKALASGETGINFFFDVKTSKYYIYYDKFDTIQGADNALKSKEDKPYNAKMSMVKIENN